MTSGNGWKLCVVSGRQLWVESMVVVIRRQVWAESMGVASGCSCKDINDRFPHNFYLSLLLL